ncbi:hypothetical protein FACS1894216_18400 [Synergistales bacterium]|nr:hypothetical protein FACS1894216_18400 [Synergistales bacterium]
MEFLYNLAAGNEVDAAICGAADKILHEKRIMTAEEAIVELLFRKKYNVAFQAKLFKSSLFRGERFSKISKIG